MGVGIPGCFRSKSYSLGSVVGALRMAANFRLRASRFAGDLPNLKIGCRSIPLLAAMKDPFLWWAPRVAPIASVGRRVGVRKGFCARSSFRSRLDLRDC